MHTNEQKFRTPLRLFLLSLWCILITLFARPALADGGIDTYYYPGYDAAANGYVDLMDYMQQITVTVDGQEYTIAQLRSLKEAGTPVNLRVGDLAQFNFRFCLSGRSYDANDPTLLDENASTHVTYSSGTTYLNGETVPAGTSAILDDSSLMQENTTADGSYLRMDISWLLDVCPGDYKIQYTDGRVSFQQRDHYLYIYFPNGIGNDTYADPGHFSIAITLSKEVETIHVPGGKGYYVPGGGGWDIELPVRMEAHDAASGDITTYGDIIVYKVWQTNGQAHPDAKILLTYAQNGKQQTSSRTLRGDVAKTMFTIRSGMTDCHLEEDMTGLDGYVSTLSVSADGKTYTFTNSSSKTISFSKRAIQGSEELPGAQLTVYKKESDGSETEVESWTSDTAPHTIALLPGSYRLHESLAPKGYAVSQDIAFTLGTDLTLQSETKDAVDGDTLRIYDTPLVVKFKKVDSEGNALTGAVLTLTDQNTGEEVDRWTSDGSLHTITLQTASGKPLVAGHTYILHEESAPNGYTLAQDISFIFNGDGTIPSHGYATIVMEDKPSRDNTNRPTPAPSSSPNSDDSRNKPTPVPGTADGGNGNDNGNGNGSNIVQTGDSPLMWLWLVLGVGYLVAGLLVALYYYRRSQIPAYWKLGAHDQ